jgi:pilus assembly protein CpaC
MHRLSFLFACALVAPALVAQGAPAQDSLTLSAGRSQHVESAFPVAGVSVTDLNVADVQLLAQRLVLVSAKAPGVTDVLMWGDGGEVRSLRVEVTLDLAQVEGDLSVLLPGSEVKVVARGGTTVVAGRLARAEQAATLDAYFTARELPWVDATSLAGGQQVSVQVRLAEVSRTGLRELGVNILKTGESFFGGSVIGSGSGGPINPISIGALAGDTALGNTPFAFTSTTGVSPGVTLFAGFPKADLEYFIQALSENEYLRILAEPNLVALSGEEARFLAGGEFPIPVVQGGGTSGGTSVTIEYKEFGISLRFRPLVLGDGTIRLRVFTEVSDLSEVGAVEIQGFQVPAVVTRNAETTVEMHSGQTFSLAGLLSNKTAGRVSKVPGLGDLPVLGPLFRSTHYTSGETELVLLVTTSLVEPLSVAGLPALPGEGHVAPSDWELFYDGHLEGEVIEPPAGPSAEWLRSAGLAGLLGPGGWVRHGQAPAPSRARPQELAAAGAVPEASSP